MSIPTLAGNDVTQIFPFVFFTGFSSAFSPPPSTHHILLLHTLCYITLAAVVVHMYTCTRTTVKFKSAGKVEPHGIFHSVYLCLSQLQINLLK